MTHVTIAGTLYLEFHLYKTDASSNSICSCCYGNIIWDPCAICCGPWENDFNLLKIKIDKRVQARAGGGAPAGDDMVRK